MSEVQSSIFGIADRTPQKAGRRRGCRQPILRRQSRGHRSVIARHIRRRRHRPIVLRQKWSRWQIHQHPVSRRRHEIRRRRKRRQESASFQNPVCHFARDRKLRFKTGNRLSEHFNLTTFQVSTEAGNNFLRHHFNLKLGYEKLVRFLRNYKHKYTIFFVVTDPHIVGV